MAEAAKIPKSPEPIAFIDLKAQRRRLGARVDQAIARVLDHGQYILGPEVKVFEDRLAAHCGARHAIGCGSGTDALILALLALGARAGDAVFVPSMTFAATAEAVALLGATPVFVEVDETSFNMAADSLARAIDMIRAEGTFRPVGVIPVDLYGQPADYRAIGAVADRYGLWVVADAAQSYGASLAGRKVGRLARMTTTSFFPAKPLGCYGDGGAVFTDDDELAARVRSLLFHGKGADKYDNVRIGMNGRLDTIQAAVLIEKLAIFDDEMVRRQVIADRYAAGLAGAAELPLLMPGAISAWAQYTLVVDGREAVAAKLKADGIPTQVYYPKPLHLQTAYRHFPVAPGGLALTERLSATVLSLPMHPYLDEATQDRVVAAVRRALA
jgi:dTDP-4-amino-4,6-dideoxygalactose transaminase